MAIWETLKTDVTSIFNDAWDIVDGRTIPDTSDVGLGKKGKRIEATILYADLKDSTGLVDGYKDWFAAEVYKAYLICAVKIIRDNDGKIASFDGDRGMGIFHGDSKETRAVRSALQINGAVIKVINPLMVARYEDVKYRVAAACGVGSSQILVARTGIRDNSDLVWVGHCANHAAKYCSMRVLSYASFISKAVYDAMDDGVRIGGDSKNMWEFADTSRTIYRSSYMMGPPD
jgi:class 3 adenylate cyclase